MAYRVIRNRRTGQRTLEFYTTPRGLTAHLMPLFFGLFDRAILRVLHAS